MSCSSSFTCKIYLFWFLSFFSFTLIYCLWLKRRLFLNFQLIMLLFSFERVDYNYIAWGILCSLCFSLTAYVTVLMVVEAASSERTPPLSRCTMILYDSVSWPWVLLTNHSLIRSLYFIQVIFLYLWYIPLHSCTLLTHFSSHQFFSYVYYRAKYFSYPWWRCCSRFNHYF